jgi:hypothetical protein
MERPLWQAGDFDTALWLRLVDFHVDPAGAELTFLRRLAREQVGWTLADAEQAWFEYLRFLYLACKCDHPVTPSNEVDAVWHLHLTYSENYWKKLCPEVLGFEFHHGPTQGGPQEGQRYREQYQRTLSSYAVCFGSPAPQRFWPKPEVRFRQRMAAYDRQRFVLVPRYWLRIIAPLSVVFLLAAIMLSMFLLK